MLIVLLLIVPLVYSAPSQSHHQAATEHGHTGKPAGVVGIRLWAPGFVTTRSRTTKEAFPALSCAFSAEFALQPFPQAALFWGVPYIWLSSLQDLSYHCNLSASIRLAEIDWWVQKLLEKDTPTSLCVFSYGCVPVFSGKQACYRTHLFS